MASEVEEQLMGWDWWVDCYKWRGKLLIGRYGHWCLEWDDLPVDETCEEIAWCQCFEGDLQFEAIREKAWEEAEERMNATGTDCMG